jgi:autotransporter-associated beta strand protein
LDVQNAAALGTTAGGTTVAAGATLDIESDNGLSFTDRLTLGTAKGGGTLLMLGGNNTWAGNIAVAATSMINVATGQLTLTGVLSGAGGVTKAGAGTLVYAGTTANTYAGRTTVNGGRLQLDNSGGNALAGPLTVGAGANVEYLSDNQVSDTAKVTVGAAATFDLNGHSDTVGALVLNGGVFDVGINGTAAGGYGQLMSAGSVALGGSILNVLLGSFTPPSGTSFTIIARAGAGSSNSTFAGLPEGATFNLGSTTFKITYIGGPGHHDVVLSVL